MRSAFSSRLAVSDFAGGNVLYAEPKPLEPAEFAIIDMEYFDKLGPLTREAIRRTRFGGSARLIMRRWGGPFADDEAVARRVRADDDKFSGQFNAAASEGI